MKNNTIAEVQVNYVPKKQKQLKISCSNDAIGFFRSVWSDQISYREEMYVALLNRANMILGYNKLSVGGTSSTVVDVKMLMQLLLKTNTHSFILCHNHPSGQLKASHQDKELTKQVKAAGKLLDIQLLDHLILSADGFHSMADEGMME